MWYLTNWNTNIFGKRKKVEKKLIFGLIFGNTNTNICNTLRRGGTVSPEPEIHTNITNMFCPLCSASGGKYDAVLFMGCLLGCSLVGPWVKS